MSDRIPNFKNRFARAPHFIHLNNAGLAPICLDAKEKVIYWAERFYQEGFWTDADYMADVAQSRQSLSSLIGCLPNEIAWFQSAAGGINQFAFGINLKPGDEVVMWDQEYSSHLYPWKAACDFSGASLKLLDSPQNLETPTDMYIAALSTKTKVAAFSWVQFSSGARMDVESVIKECKRRGIFVFVDAAQGLGVHTSNLWAWGADAVVGSSHKWLVSPVGVGYLAIRNAISLKMVPRNFGAYTYGTCDDPSDFACEPKRDATKFEPGSKQVLEITALGAACRLIEQTGVEHIQDEALRLAKVLREGLKDLNFDILNSFMGNETPIITFSHQNRSLEEIAAQLTKNNINFARRGGGLRLSPHAFNTDEEILAVLRVLKDF